MRMIRAGPEQKADAKNRGAKMDAFQKGRATSPLYINAVTVCMLTAHGIESRMKTPMNFQFGSRIW